MMREVAGTGDPDRYDEVPARTVLDLAASWTFQPGARVYVSAYNLFDVEYVVSHRPYGARPGMPAALSATTLGCARPRTAACPCILQRGNASGRA
jgi:outer membrane receptor protein involved in Fe transport